MARHRFKQSDSLQDRLAVFAQDLRDQAALLAPGALKDDLIRRARQADTALHLDDWANSPGLQIAEIATNALGPHSRNSSGPFVSRRRQRVRSSADG